MGVRAAFIGLGVMGFPMAGHLVRAGHDVTVYNRTRGKAEAWVAKFGGRLADTPAEAAREAELVFACVGNDDDLRSVTLGELGALAGMRQGAIFVDHTTASAQVARALAGLAHDKGWASSTRRSPAARRGRRTGSWRSWWAAIPRPSPAPRR